MAEATIDSERLRHLERCEEICDELINGLGLGGNYLDLERGVIDGHFDFTAEQIAALRNMQLSRTEREARERRILDGS